MAVKSHQSKQEFPILRRFLSDPQFQSKVLWMMMGLCFFIFPAMLMGGKVLFDIFIDPQGLDSMRGPDHELMLGKFLEDITMKVTIIGIIFSIGWTLVLRTTKGYADLEFVFVLISLMMVITAAVIAFIMTDRCYDPNSCDTFKFTAGIFCIVSITVFAYILSAGVGKRVGWFSFFFLPVLVYQTSLWIPKLLLPNQQDRMIDEVLKPTGLLFTAFVLGVLLAVIGGWPSRGQGNSA